MTNTFRKNASPICNINQMKMHKLNAWWLLWCLFILPGYVGPSYPSYPPSSYPPSTYPNPAFVPAMPGKTPKCVKDPRLTFCVEIEKYPKERIVYLLEQKMFDTDTLLQDETRDTYTFEARDAGVITVANPIPYGKPPFKGYPPSKGQSHYHPPNNTNFGYHRPPKYGGSNHLKPPPISPNAQYSTSNFYSSSASPSFNSFTSSHSNKYESSFNSYNGHSTPLQNDSPYPRYPKGRFRTTPAPYQPSGSQQSWWKKILRREKRQSDDGLNDLCPARANYIMPQAAQRVVGDWMFVVNVDERYTQLVKSETCIRNTCEGSCDVPNGFSAICQQQYVQKRLIALDGSGAKLNSDIFWFPSCCICKIRPNTG